jgi:hypothetical protein
MAVAVAVALIFTAGGAGQKKDKAAVTSEGTVSPLDTAVDIKDVLNDVKLVEEVPATTTTPAATTTTLVATNPGQTFTQVRAVGGGKGGCVCLLVCVCVCSLCCRAGGCGGVGCFAVPLGKAGPPFPPPLACPSLLSFSLWP